MTGVVEKKYCYLQNLDGLFKNTISKGRDRKLSGFKNLWGHRRKRTHPEKTQ
jgi:hypothetical protein